MHMEDPVDLSQAHGPALTTTQLGEVVGVSSQTIRMEIAAGELSAVRIGRGLKRREYRIPWREARRYARQLGVL